MRKQNRKIRRIPNRRLNKERWIMTVSSLFVLTALTITGVFVNGKTNDRADGYVVDFSKIEEKEVENEPQVLEQQIAENAMDHTAVTSNSDLDYDPYYQETNSGNVENENTLTAKISAEEEEKTRTETEDHSESMSTGAKDAMSVGAVTGENGEQTTALSTAMQPTLNFSEEDQLVWPIVGNVLVNYSMDKTIFFPTLQQYKYNPAIVIQAVEGETITAAAAGKVKEIFYDTQIGNAITVDLGNGYELTYGQLTNILVSEGSYVSVGDALADVAAPTKYYSVEGFNVYFKLTKDGEPVNPLTKLS